MTITTPIVLKATSEASFAKGTIECNLSFYSAEALIVKRLPRQSAGFVKNDLDDLHASWDIHLEHLLDVHLKA